MVIFKYNLTTLIRLFDFYNLGNVLFRQHFLDGDMTFQSDDGSGGVTTYFKLDGGNVNVSVAKDFLFQDNVKAKFGNGGDLEIYHDASNSYIEQSGTGDLVIKTSNAAGDIKFQSGSVDFMFMDSSQTAIRMKRKTKWDDNIKATFGDGEDLEIYHDGTNSVLNNTTGHLQLYNNANDKDIIFLTDDGSGGTTEYFKVDGGKEKNIFSKPISGSVDITGFTGSFHSLKSFRRS